MGFFEKYLTLWVALCIIVGVALGYLAPGIFQIFGRIQLAQINLPVAVLIWLMIIPMLIKIDLTALSGVTRFTRGIGVTLFVNWQAYHSIFIECITGHAGPAVWVSGHTNYYQANHNFITLHSDTDPGNLQLRTGLSTQQNGRFAPLRGRAVRSNRCQQFFRVGRGYGSRVIRL